MNTTQEVWHAGELAAQARAGVKKKMSSIGPRVIRNYMPTEHREFFTSQSLVIVGSEDKKGDLWASPIFGHPGFIQSPTAKLLAIDTSAFYSHLVFPQLNIGHQVGLLGIDFETRRRNRLNGVVTEKNKHHISIKVQQSFGNCPQYIQQRRIEIQPQRGQITRTFLSSWSSRLREFIARADTCFIASAYAVPHADESAGMDVSHRGGQPGFIGFDEHDRLTIPDYRGNFFFNTVGNLTEDPRAGLLFLDFSEGLIITLTMTAEVIWKTENPILCGGYERVIRLSLKGGYLIRNALPLIGNSG
ncbi:MAG: pyridoxamine 5'-phosphate oxidase family protein [Gammaproteobacteria bacterium]|nr:pyridoxamine 5'-phosphate oxidase family protein [Gammaproteobacteria bacterium]